MNKVITFGYGSFYDLSVCVAYKTCIIIVILKNSMKIYGYETWQYCQTLLPATTAQQCKFSKISHLKPVIKKHGNVLIKLVLFGNLILNLKWISVSNAYSK